MAALHLMIHFNLSNLNLHLTKSAIKCTYKTYIVHYFGKCQIQEGGTASLQMRNYLPLLPARWVQGRTNSPGASDDVK